ncbi:hypothetical protein DDQ50_05105 [Amnibacterium flavum]|uniref:Uncharacterized protein n=2 Tax=Amnibacterium flavum TaxID=2173173 RepID=A0A2V1HTF3_9MICO|nr:hypothetical protein DDQ50_05105 [Amnibacterium flavum]
MTLLDPSVVWSTFVAVVVLVTPGLLIAGAASIRGIALVALAAPLTIATVGVVGVLSEFVGVWFGWWSVLVLALVAAIATRLLMRKRTPPAWARGSSHDALVLSAGALVALIVVGVIAYRDTPVGAISQTYDAVFHLNAAASILDTGRASSLELYRLTNPDSASIDFYPAAWHSLVALTSQIALVPVATATGAVWIAVAGALWTPGVVLLTRAVVGRHALPGWRLLIPVALSTCFAAFPYLLLSWGTLYPTGLATALLPAGLALLWFAVPLNRVAFARGVLPAFRRSVYPASLLLVWVVAAVFAHPRTLITFVALAVPLAVLVIVLASQGLRRAGRRRSAMAVVAIPIAAVVIAVAAAGVILVRAYDLVNDPISNRLTGGPATAHQDLLASAIQVLTAAPLSAPGDLPLPPAILLAAAVLAGAVLAFRSRRALPVVLGVLVMGVLYCLAAGSNDDLAKILTAAWYKDKYRLISVLPLLSIPLIVLTLEWLRRGIRHGPRIAAAALAATVLLSWFGPTLSVMSEQIGRTFALPQSEKAGTLIDADEIALLEQVASIVPADQRVLSNPWDGSSLVWAIGHREPVFPHLVGVWGADRDIVATRLDEAGTSPDVCEALDNLRVRYVIADPEKLWGGTDPQAALYAGIDRAVASATLVPVLTEGSTVLYRIDACGPLL